MDLGQNLGNSFGYGRKLFSDFGRCIILIILDIIPIVNLIVGGYAARVIQTTPTVEEPPKLERYGDMFIDGLKILVASIIYMIIPLIIIIVGAGSVIGGIFGMGMGGPAGFALTGFGALLLLVGVIVAIIIAIFSVIGIAHMIKTNNFGKAFAFGEIREIIGRIGWGKYLLWIILILVIAAVWGGIVAGLNVIVPFLGTIIGAVLGPAVAVFYGRSIGLIYNDGAPDYTRSYPMAPPPTAPGMYPPPPPAAPAAAAGFCMNCGAPLQPHQKFCPSCGQPVK